LALAQQRCPSSLAHRSWIFPRDPHFAAKAGLVLDLYERIWERAPLGPNDFVISADEKNSIQARRRKQPTLPGASDRPIRVEHEYFREGAWTYLAAWDVHRAKVFGRCEHKTGIAPVDRLVSEVMSQVPYKSAHRVFWIMDNRSAHRALIEQGLDRGRNAMAIWQLSDHGFPHGYQTVKRFVRKVRGSESAQAVGIILTPAGEESQVDYGSGPMVRDSQSGKYRRTRLFVLTLGTAANAYAFWYGVRVHASGLNSMRNSIKARALSIAWVVGQTRWLQYTQQAVLISMPLLVTLVFWLIAIFVSFGLFAPRNAAVIVCMFISAASVSGAILMIVEMYAPYRGLMQLSSAPLRAALAQLGR
jgi:hypothetical protein